MVSIFTPGIDACAADAAECEINVRTDRESSSVHPQETSSNIPPETVSDTRAILPVALLFCVCVFLLQKTSSGNP